MKILLIEDRAVEAKWVQGLLANIANVEHCTSWKAVQLCLQQERADAVLLGVDLPDAKELETCSHLQAAFPDVAFVLYGEADSPEVAIEAVQSGAQDYIVKADMNERLLHRCLRYAIERKQAEADKLALERRLRQAQKMEAIGLLAGGVAHDFNNILTLIIGHSELALEEIPPGDESGQRFTDISQAAKRATDLIRQLLLFSRDHAGGKVRAVDINETVTRTFKMMGRLLGEDIELVLCLERGLGSVVADPGQIEQVIMNLAINARDAMPAGGRLTIETAQQQLDRRRIGNLVEIEAGNYIVLNVQDTGIGMDRETQSRVFEPFFTTKEGDGGTGLGLATVHGIIDQASGYIDIDSKPEAGTRFEVYLPMCEAVDVADNAVGYGSLRAAPRGGETILLVEDEEPLLQLGQAVLEGLGYSVIAAASPEEAIGEFVENRERIDLLVTDMVMPGLNGDELVSRLQAFNDNLKVIFVSGYDPGRFNGMLEDAAFIHKPYPPSALAHKVREILDD